MICLSQTRKAKNLWQNKSERLFSFSFFYKVLTARTFCTLVRIADDIIHHNYHKSQHKGGTHLNFTTYVYFQQDRPVFDTYRKINFVNCELNDMYF